MQLTSTHRKNIIKSYCLIFYGLMLYKIWNGFLLIQIKPAIFNTRYDLFTWIIMNSGIHQWLINNPAGWVIFDGIFFSLPLLYWFAFKNSLTWASRIAAIMLPVNWVYISCYTLYPANSIESFTAWLLFPVLFMALHLQKFYLILHGLRYYFLFLFASAGLWKIVQGGVFYPLQMSGVLLFQHKEWLTAPSNWHVQFLYWMIGHPVLGYCMYIGATVVELFFFIGFFTKKFDRPLILVFLLFLVADILMMRIPYWELTPFLLTLYFSNYREPVVQTN